MAWEICVPATTANMGPGFDVMGMALGMFNRFRVDLSDQDTVACAPGQSIPDVQEHILLRICHDICARLGHPVQGLALWQDCPIPLARGLGSSATCVVAAVMAAYAICDVPLDLDTAVNEATRWEGHPDNVAPALLGGIVLCATEAEHVRYLRFDAPAHLWTVALVPPYSLSTQQARAALPILVSLEDAVFNASRSALLTAALMSGDLSLLPIAMQDRLHQPYRQHFIPEWMDIVENAYTAGALAVTLSGAGPTLMAYGEGSPDAFVAEMRLPEGWRLLLMIPALGAKITQVDSLI